MSLVRELDNVLILRTLSKGYSLAGLRVGYGIGHPEIIEPMLTKTRDSYNVDFIAQRLATVALDYREEARKTWTLVREAKCELLSNLATIGLYAPPSESNFVLATVPNAAAVREALEARGWREAVSLRGRYAGTEETPAHAVSHEPDGAFEGWGACDVAREGAALLWDLAAFRYVQQRIQRRAASEDLVTQLGL